MPPINVATLVPGARVHHELRVVERDIKKTKNGDPYALLTLGNRHGEIKTAPVWHDKLHWVDGAEPGTIRKLFAESIEANSAHGSDSTENAATEISYFFAGTEIVG